MVTHVPEVVVGGVRLTEGEALALREALEVYVRLCQGQLAEMSVSLRSGWGERADEACALLARAGEALHPGKPSMPAASVSDGGLMAQGVVHLFDHEKIRHSSVRQELVARAARSRTAAVAKSGGRP